MPRRHLFRAAVLALVASALLAAPSVGSADSVPAKVSQTSEPAACTVDVSPFLYSTIYFGAKLRWFAYVACNESVRGKLTMTAFERRKGRWVKVARNTRSVNVDRANRRFSGPTFRVKTRGRWQVCLAARLELPDGRVFRQDGAVGNACGRYPGS